MDIFGKYEKGEITLMQRYEILNVVDIDQSNATAYYFAKRKSKTQIQQIDVYQSLVEFVKKNRAKDILIDEFPILMNPKSKLIFKYFSKYSTYTSS